MLFSVHIPKCGGTSFRAFLERRFADRLLYDYSRRWEREHLGELLPLLVGKSCFHAHAAADLFDEADFEVKKITWIRNPVDRILSYYRHILRERDLRNGYFREVIEGGMSVVEFSKLHWVANGISDFIGGTLDQYDFVGLIESPKKSLDMFEGLFGPCLDRDMSMPRLNTKEEHLKGGWDGLKIDEGDRIRIAEANAKDMKLYLTLCDRYGYSSPDKLLLG